MAWHVPAFIECGWSSNWPSEAKSWPIQHRYHSCPLAAKSRRWHILFLFLFTLLHILILHLLHVFRRSFYLDSFILTRHCFFYSPQLLLVFCRSLIFCLNFDVLCSVTVFDFFNGKQLANNFITAGDIAIFTHHPSPSLHQVVIVVMIST